MSHVTLVGDLTGEYLVREQRPDGTLLLAPNETSLEAVRRRHGLRRLTPEEFGVHFGDLPSDGTARLGEHVPRFAVAFDEFSFDRMDEKILASGELVCFAHPVAVD